MGFIRCIYLISVSSGALEQTTVPAYKMLHVIACELAKGRRSVHNWHVIRGGVHDAERALLELQVVHQVSFRATHHLVDHLVDILW